VPLLFLLLALGGLLLSTVGSDEPAAPPPSGGFTVMTFNIAHGVDGTGQYNLQRAVDLISRLQPDIVGLQEVTRNHPAYQCDDQPALLAEGLRRATRQAWHHVYVQEWSVRSDLACQQRGAGDGPNTEGLAFLARAPVSSVASQKLWNGRLALAVRVPFAPSVTFIVTHLANAARNVDDRLKQVSQLAPWAEGQGPARVLLGDLNARPGASEIGPLLRSYRDAWADASTTGAIDGIANGATRTSGVGRIDYVLYTPDRGLELMWVHTVDAAAVVGVRASDHNPVVARFRLR
jgi:endonuclease/exonuclease/phosphatase family metal-dependent hydrolase